MERGKSEKKKKELEELSTESFGNGVYMCLVFSVTLRFAWHGKEYNIRSVESTLQQCGVLEEETQQKHTGCQVNVQNSTIFHLNI